MPRHQVAVAKRPGKLGMGGLIFGKQHAAVPRQIVNVGRAEELSGSHGGHLLRRAESGMDNDHEVIQIIVDRCG